LIWLPTWRGWLLIALFLAGAGFAFLRGSYWFLAVNDPAPGGALVVEGWGADYLMEAAKNEFESRSYDGLFVTGGPLEKGSPLVEYRSCAELGAVTIVKMGLDPKKVQAVPSEAVRTDRTYASAMALKQWLGAHGRAVSKVNLMSVGAHSRRSRLLFHKAFGDEVKVGIVALEDREFEPDRWWTSSAGFRSVTGEWVAYLYARFLFRSPPN
jgi:hypothetical protein